MTRTMYDALSTQAAAIPADAELVAGYIDAGPVPAAPPWGPAEWALFPHAIHVGIATQPGTNAGDVLDVEAGDATPDQAPGWVSMRRAAGASPSVYCSASAWPTVRAAFAAAGVAEPPYWIASYSQPPDTSIPAGAVAHQWGGPASGAYDVSTVADHWPGIDPPPAPPAPEPQEGSNVVQVSIHGIAFLVWTSGGSIHYRAVNAGQLEHAAVVPGSENKVDPTNPAVLAIPVGDLAVVYVPGAGGTTLTVTWADAGAIGWLATAVQS